MSIDGNLRHLFKKHLPHVHWQPVETGGTGKGIPDVEYCAPGGFAGWIEFKFTGGFTVDFKGREQQIGWLERRTRAGGRCFVAIRRRAPFGPRRGHAVDELWLFPGSAARELHLEGLKTTLLLGLWNGGPTRWAWPEVENLLKT